MGKQTLNTRKNNETNKPKSKNLDDINRIPESAPIDVKFLIDEVLSNISDAGFPVFIDNVS